MNFVEKLFANGFERVVPEYEQKKQRFDLSFRPNNGWCGLTIYHPYERFIKNNTIIELSLERFGVNDIFIDADNRVIETPVNEKLIKISRGGNLIYENKYGVFPPKEIEDIFL